jgi:hypothetical protein
MKRSSTQIKPRSNTEQKPCVQRFVLWCAIVIVVAATLGNNLAFAGIALPDNHYQWEEAHESDGSPNAEGSPMERFSWQEIGLSITILIGSGGLFIFQAKRDKSSSGESSS